MPKPVANIFLSDSAKIRRIKEICSELNVSPLPKRNP
jgi:hypothetical protein